MALDYLENIEIWKSVLKKHRPPKGGRVGKSRFQRSADGRREAVEKLVEVFFQDDSPARDLSDSKLAAVGETINRGSVNA